MKGFKELGVKSSLAQAMTGEKIKISRVLNKLMEVHNFSIKDSQFTGKCLYLQIKIDNEMRVVFTSGKSLIDVIQKIPKTDFPFSTTIVKEETDRLEFT